MEVDVCYVFKVVVDSFYFPPVKEIFLLNNETEMKILLSSLFCLLLGSAFQRCFELMIQLTETEVRKFF
jgi:hypothetical protein